MVRQPPVTVSTAVCKGGDGRPWWEEGGLVWYGERERDAHRTEIRGGGGTYKIRFLSYGKNDAI